MMKKIHAFVVCLLMSLSLYAQETVPDSFDVYSHKNSSFTSNWKAEFSVRTGVQVYYKFTDFTAGYRITPSHVLGAGFGFGNRYYDAVPADDYHYRFFLYHRFYLPLDRNHRFSFYSDILMGGKYVYKATSDQPDVDRKGSWGWLWSWQPGLSIRVWGKSNIFFGPNIGPSPGLHIGIAL